MRKIAIIRRGLFTITALMLSFAAFFLGRLTMEAEHDESALVKGSGDADEVSGDGVQIPANAYLLKREGNTMTVICGSTVIAAFDETLSHMSAEAKQRLNEGVVFQSLADIESYIEGHDS